MAQTDCGGSGCPTTGWRRDLSHDGETAAADVSAAAVPRTALHSRQVPYATPARSCLSVGSACCATARLVLRVASFSTAARSSVTKNRPIATAYKSSPYPVSPLYAVQVYWFDTNSK